MAVGAPPRRYEFRVFPPLPERLVSLDAYRGFVMLLMMSGGLGLAETAKEFPRHRLWQTVGFHAEHVAWEGCSLWDLIQPCFMFIVGTSLAFSAANRRTKRQPYALLLAHALLRSLVLILLGIALASLWSSQTEFVFTNVLTQIGLGYVFLFLLWGQSIPTLLIVTGCILLTYWCYFFFYPLPPADFDYASVNVPANWPHLQGIRAHWDLNTNAAAAFDRWFLNLFPQADPTKPYIGTPRGYVTLNFVPSLATMILGLVAGQWLRSDRSMARRAVGLIAGGLIAIAIGYLLHVTGACPIVKRIWTPSWTLYSAGWAAILLAAFFFLFEMINLRPLAAPLLAIGMNSLAIYVLSHLIKVPILDFFKRHFGSSLFRWMAHTPGLVNEETALRWQTSPPADVFELFGPYAPIAKNAIVLLVLWGIALWMYRRRIFVKI